MEADLHLYYAIHRRPPFTVKSLFNYLVGMEQLPMVQLVLESIFRLLFKTSVVGSLYLTIKARQLHSQLQSSMTYDLRRKWHIQKLGSFGVSIPFFLFSSVFLEVKYSRLSIHVKKRIQPMYSNYTQTDPSKRFFPILLCMMSRSFSSLAHLHSASSSFNFNGEAIILFSKLLLRIDLDQTYYVLYLSVPMIT